MKISGRKELKRLVYICFLAGLCIVCSIPKPALSADETKYMGVTYCKMCHAPQSAGWAQTRHAKALDSLKKTNQHDLPDCVKCHVTGYEEPGGFIDFELTPNMAGVQCEACHGPGNKHKGEKKDIISAPGQDKCRKCHTPGQDPKFNYDEKKKTVHGQNTKK